MDSQSNTQASHPFNEDIQIFIENNNGTEDDIYFDDVVGALQAIVLEPNFSALQQSFIKDHCVVFQDQEENKMEYMQIFMEYQIVIEKHIINELNHRVNGFSMESFSNLLSSRTDQIDQDLLEMINSFTQFNVFKQLMLQHKKYYSQQQKFNSLCIKGENCKFSHSNL